MRTRLIITGIVLAVFAGLAQLASTQPALERRISLPLVANGKPTNTLCVCPSPTPTPTLSPTSVPAGGVQIIDIVLYDPNFPEDSEYLQILNTTNGPVDMAGWRIINTTRSERPTYFFPRYTLLGGNTAVLYSAEGEDDLDAGDFYWDRTDQIWNPGDVAELRDRGNRLIHSFTVLE